MCLSVCDTQKLFREADVCKLVHRKPHQANHPITPHHNQRQRQAWPFCDLFEL
jgi:hypothetical protein